MARQVLRNGLFLRSLAPIKITARTVASANAGIKRKSRFDKTMIKPLLLVMIFGSILNAVIAEKRNIIDMERKYKLKLDKLKEPIRRVHDNNGKVDFDADDELKLVNLRLGKMCIRDSDSGVEEFPPIGKEYIEEALKVLAEEDTMMMFHAELPKAHEDQQQPEQSHREYSSFLSSRPDSFEIDAINLILECLRARNGPVPPVHIVHLASMKAIPLIRKARASGLPVTTETCFHYLCIAAEQIPDGATYFKCCPPIRSESNRQGLWDALREGVIGSVVSDHSPCTPELKNLQKGDFFDSWGGIASVGLGLPLMFTQGCSLVDIVTWCCKNTSHQVGLSHQKGTIAPGYDADLVVFDTASEHKISNSSVYFKNKLTAYNGMTVKGTVLKTILRGQVVYTNANGVSKTPLGQTLLDSRR